MKARLQISKDGALLYEADCEIADAESFGKACADVWWQLRQRQFAEESSIGALMEHIDSNVLDQLNGTTVRLKRL
jgi:hypothetical protein